MVPSGPPAFSDKIVSVAVIGKPYAGSGIEFLISALRYSLQNQYRTERDHERGRYGGKESAHGMSSALEEPYFILSRLKLMLIKSILDAKRHKGQATWNFQAQLNAAIRQ